VGISCFMHSFLWTFRPFSIHFGGRGILYLVREKGWPREGARQGVITHIIRCTRSHVIQLLSLLSGRYRCYSAAILRYSDVIRMLPCDILLLSFVTQLSSCCYPAVVLCYPVVILVIRLLSFLSGCYHCYPVNAVS